MRVVFGIAALRIAEMIPFDCIPGSLKRKTGRPKWKRPAVRHHPDDFVYCVSWVLFLQQKHAVRAPMIATSMFTPWRVCRYVEIAIRAFYGSNGSGCIANRQFENIATRLAHKPTSFAARFRSMNLATLVRSFASTGCIFEWGRANSAVCLLDRRIKLGLKVLLRFYRFGI